MIFALTTNAIIVLILYFYIYLLESRYLFVTIMDTVFIGMVFISLNCNLIVFIENCIYSYLLDWI